MSYMCANWNSPFHANHHDNWAPAEIRLCSWNLSYRFICIWFCRICYCSNKMLELSTISKWWKYRTIETVKCGGWGLGLGCIYSRSLQQIGQSTASLQNQEKYIVIWWNLMIADLEIMINFQARKILQTRLICSWTGTILSLVSDIL